MQCVPRIHGVLLRIIDVHKGEEDQRGEQEEAKDVATDMISIILRKRDGLITVLLDSRICLLLNRTRISCKM